MCKSTHVRATARMRGATARIRTWPAKAAGSDWLPSLTSLRQVPATPKNACTHSHDNDFTWRVPCGNLPRSATVRCSYVDAPSFFTNHGQWDCRRCCSPCTPRARECAHNMLTGICRIRPTSTRSFSTEPRLSAHASDKAQTLLMKTRSPSLGMPPLCRRRWQSAAWADCFVREASHLRV